MNNLIFVTGNANKQREAESILGFPIELISLDLDEIQSMDLETVVRKKVQQAYEKIKRPVFVDDVGMFVTAWNGFPGPLIKHVAAIDDHRTFVRWMELEENRHTTVVCAIGFHDGHNIHVFYGEVSGTIVQPRGEGWGFRPIFQPEGSDRTWGEIPDDMLNTLSHRALALKKFKEFLSNS